MSPSITVENCGVVGNNAIKSRGHHWVASAAEEEVEAHIPTLKGLGKSDCEVKIVAVSDCEPWDPTDLLNSDHTTMSLRDTLHALKDHKGHQLSLSEGRNSFFWPGTRTAQAQKALRRPVLEYRFRQELSIRQNFIQQPRSPREYVNDTTLRKLTSSKWAVRKVAFSGRKQDGSRLLKQMQKQIEFSKICRNSRMEFIATTPEVYGIGVQQKGSRMDQIIVDMEYIPFQDVSHIILQHDITIHEWYIDTVIAIVDNELKESTVVPLESILGDFRSKAEGVQSAITNNSLLNETEIVEISGYFDAILGYFEKLQGVQVPVGRCHGDLTFQNMLVDPINRELCVFDFLDTFLESPLQDIAKVLQDCRHHWFLTQVSIPNDCLVRACTVLGVFYDHLQHAYYRYAFWDVVPLFEFFCLARILLYMTSEIEKQCVMDGLQRIIADLGLDLLASEPSSPNYTFTSDSSSNSETTPAGISDTSTIIVPALGPDMSDIYAQGQSKLLVVNPSGRPLIVESVGSLDLRNAHRVIIAVS